MTFQEEMAKRFSEEIAVAKAIYEGYFDHDLEIPEDPEIIQSGDDGVWIEARVWVETDKKVADVRREVAMSESVYFVNHYECPKCERCWQDVWSATCDDECPYCGLRDISPVRSEELPGDPKPEENHDL